MIIYKTTNLINGKIYIGKDEKNKKTYLGSGKILKLAIRKYGRENFSKTTLEFCNKDNINEREIFWISKYKSQDPEIGYNLAKGGEGGGDGSKKGRKVSDETREKIRNTMRGVKHTKQRRKNISNSLKGRKMSQEFRDKVSHGIRNSEKYRISRKNLIGKKHSIEHKKKISESLKGKKNPFYGKKHSEKSKQKMIEKRFIVVDEKIIIDIKKMRNNGAFYRQIKDKYGFSVTKIKSILIQEVSE